MIAAAVMGNMQILPRNKGIRSLVVHIIEQPPFVALANYECFRPYVHIGGMVFDS